MLGYGSQGRALALNLRDSGYDVIIGLPRRSKSRSLAGKDGFGRVGGCAQAVRKAALICFAVPDHLHGHVYARDVEKNLISGATLLFLHGMSIHFGFVEPPDDCDVVMLAPHAPGLAVREKFLGDRTVSAFYAVHQNVSGRAERLLFDIACAAGFKRKRLLETTFEAEALGDIFGEQAVLCGGLAMLIKNGFEVLVENGLKPENAYLEVAYQLDLIIGLVKKYGIEGMLRRVSVTARLGAVENGPRIIDERVKSRMVKVYKDIRDGRFARRLAALDASDLKAMNRTLKTLSHPDLEKAVKKLS
jgi:ketol-acid reductoisomerase